MRYYGKIFGAILGWMLLRHPVGAVIGGILGHALDAGWFSRQSGAGDSRLDDAYQVLGLQPGVGMDEVEKAYRRLISDYHPDKVSGSAKEIRELAETRARAINSAYETIQKQHRASN